MGVCGGQFGAYAGRWRTVGVWLRGRQNLCVHVHADVEGGVWVRVCGGVPGESPLHFQIICLIHFQAKYSNC